MDEHRLALATVAAMQQASPLAISLQFAEVDDALATTSAALIVSNGSDPVGPAIAAVLNRAPAGDADGVLPGLATIVAVQNAAGGDIVAVLAHDGDDAAEALIEQLRLRGWTSFDGGAVGVDDEGQRVVEAAAGRVPPVELDALDDVESPGTSRSPFVLFGLGALLVLVLAVVIVVIRSIIATFTGSRAR